MRWDCTNEEYHADRTCISRSTLELVRESPKLYPLWRDGKWKRKETQEFRMGTAFHCMILEPSDFANKYWTTDYPDKRGKDYKKSVIEHPDHVVLSRPEWTQLNEMRRQLNKAPEAHDLFVGGQNEQSWKFTHSVIGFDCKIRPDCLKSDIHTCVELKTSKNPETFLKSVQAYGYHRQEAFYWFGLGQNDIELKAFKFVVVGTEIPEPKVCIYELDEVALKIGLEQIQTMICDFRDRKNANNWREKNWNKTIPLSLESWYIKQHEEGISP